MGKISDLINQMIDKALGSAEFTSANPTHINYLIQINEKDSPDFEAEIQNLIKDPTQASTNTDTQVQTKKTQQQIDDLDDKLGIFDKGNVGEIHRLTSEQFGNVRSLAQNPSGFMMSIFFRKFAKGVGIVSLALLIFEAVKWIIGELMKPGRMLDRRFKRDIRNEIIAFRRREEQQKLKQGFSSIIITASPRLRGGYGQTFNTLDIAGNRVQAPDNLGMNNVLMEASGGVSLNNAQSARRNR